MTKARTPPKLITLVLLTGMSVLSLNMFLPSLGSIAADLDAPYATVNLAIAGYLGVTAIIQLVVGPLSDRVGRRPVLLASVLGFTFASLMCAVATEIWTFLIFRMLQGGMITGYVLSLAIARDTRPEREAAGVIGYISGAMAVAPMLGPMLGGALDAGFGWRANFYVYAICGLVLFVICWVDLGETRRARGTRHDAAQPRLGDVLTSRLFWVFSLCSTFSTGAFYIFLTGAPLVAQSQLDMTTAELGFFVGTITAGFLMGSLVAGRYAPRYQPITMMIAGRVVACTGLSAGIGMILLGALSPMSFFSSTLFVGIGNGITMPSSHAAAMSVRPALSASSAGISGAMIVAGGAVLTTLTGFILPPDAPALMLLVLMLAASATGLIALLPAIRRASRPARS